MAQEIIQTQEQSLIQTQKLRLTAQQLQVVRMIQMPLAQLEENVQREIDENPGLDAEYNSPDDNTQESYGDASDDGSYSMDNQQDSTSDDTYESNFQEREQQGEREDELNSVLDSIDIDDRLPNSNYERTNNHEVDADQEERIYGNLESFYDRLTEQVGEQSLTERQQKIMSYLIGSLDIDGLLRMDIDTISDEIAIYEYIDTTAEEIEEVLKVLQSFDPAGIGAQSLQECLLIQIYRKASTHLTKLMYIVINDHYDNFIHKRWQLIQDRMNMSDTTAKEVFDELCKLNPRPGAALGETIGRSIEQVTPDFTIDVDLNNNISVTLNRGRVPTLFVSPDLEEMIAGYKSNPKSMTRGDKEALLYAEDKVKRAKLFIDAINQRHRTMLTTMRAIVSLQQKFIISGDDSDLKPMILKDVAERAGVDISTVSRVCNSKYAETPWGLIALKTFFSDGYKTGNDEEVSTREIKKALRELVEKEDKRKPMSDIKLAAEMKTLGYPIARRTVAKYREQMGIPPSNLRK